MFHKNHFMYCRNEYILRLLSVADCHDGLQMLSLRYKT